MEFSDVNWEELTRRELYDFYDIYWRVEFSDGDWDELTRRELRHGITLTAQVSSSAQVSSPTAGTSSRAPCFKLGGCVAAVGQMGRLRHSRHIRLFAKFRFHTGFWLGEKTRPG